MRRSGEISALVKNLRVRTSAWVYCNCAPAKTSIDDRPMETLAVTGLEWGGVPPGVHEIKIVDAFGERKLPIQGSNAPLVTIFVYAKPEPNTGTLTLVAGEDNVTVFVNNKPYRQQTQKGQLRISNLLAGRYTIRVAKDGYEPVPEQTTVVAKGAEVNLQFQLRQAVKMASLQLRGAVAGARVLMDGAALGVVQPDGTFTAEVVPGDHSIELRKDPARSKPVSKRFAAGQTVQFPGTELALERPPGTLRFRVSPQGARVTIRLQNEPESQARVVSQDSMPLPEGTYVVSANAPDYKSHLSIVVLAAGGTATVEVALQKREAPPPVVIKTLGMREWESKSWTPDGGWYVHRGGNYVSFRPTPVDGTISFTIELRKGKRLQWFVNRVDDKNYIIFRMDKKNFYREQYVNGRSMGAMKISHGLEKENSYSLRIDVGPDRIVHSVKRGENWSGLDSWNQPGKGFDRGQFGLYIPGRDEFAIRNFVLTPRAR
ncbi:MAG: carboxypeptidase-like regulatory domain-containing protein [Bryobacteraceae bacterium]